MKLIKFDYQYHKKWNKDGYFTYKGLTYKQGINGNSALLILNSLENEYAKNFKIDDKIYVYDEFKTSIYKHGQVDRYQGGRAYGTILKITNNMAKIKIFDNEIEDIEIIYLRKEI